jgi:hypothetical protein
MDMTIGAGRYPDGSQLIKYPSKTVSTILKAKLSVIRSIPMSSFFPGKSAAIKAYPGVKKKRGKTKNILRKVSLKGGISTKAITINEYKVTASRSSIKIHFLKYGIIIKQ